MIVDEVDDEGATCRTRADAPEIDGNLFIDEGFAGLKPGDIVTVEVEEAERLRPLGIALMDALISQPDVDGLGIALQVVLP